MQDIPKPSRRILVIDDNPAIHEDFRKILECGAESSDLDETMEWLFDDTTPRAKQGPAIQVDSAFQGKQALDMVVNAVEEDRPYSLAFVDMRMPPGWDGLKTIEEIWKHEPDLQVVICTAYSDTTWSDICEVLGYTDRLLLLKKPFDIAEVSQLAVAMTEKWSLAKRAQSTQIDLERLVAQRTAELTHAAQHDALTDLPNRTLFQSRLASELEHSLQHGNNVSVVLLDLDHFKMINDTMGHPAGDALLCEVADRLKDITGTGIAARLGGDEFALIQREAMGQKTVEQLLERVQASLKRPFNIEGKNLCCNISMGVATAPRDGIELDDLLRHADVALYTAKNEGRGAYRFFDAEMNAQVRARRKTVTELEQAVEQEEFELHYQPLFDTQTEDLCVLEALVRWRHPTRGLLLPADFIPLAEDTGLIVSIGEWVLQEAIREACQWPESVRLAVNVSPIQLQHGGLKEHIVQTLELHDFDPRRLELEITETALVRNCEEALDALTPLRELGVRIVMDDFGVGYSSLGYLRRFPFDKLKLDRSFVAAANESDEALAILRAVAVLGESLGIDTTAEGVETERQLERVATEGYTQIQGFLYGKPTPPDDVSKFFTGEAATVIASFGDIGDIPDVVEK